MELLSRSAISPGLRFPQPHFPWDAPGLGALVAAWGGAAGGAGVAVSRGWDGPFGMAAEGRQVSLKDLFFLGCGESSLQEQLCQLHNPAGLQPEARALWMRARSLRALGEPGASQEFN